MLNASLYKLYIFSAAVVGQCQFVLETSHNIAIKVRT